jgi:oxygen-independent coproporphyrinogen-3 oxidase
MYQCSSLYIHWPFCPYKCHFCPFVAIAGADHLKTRYYQALRKEIIQFLGALDEKPVIKTVFLGGGTPSTWPDDTLLDMFGTLKEIVVYDQQPEITIEVNPGTVRAPQLAVWQSCGINRLSIGVQSLKDSALHALNRKQSAADVIWLLNQASTSFKNISIDLILGLPGVSTDEWKELLKTVIDWPINHISVYFLTVHEDTALHYKVKKQEIELMQDDAMVDQYLYTIDYLAAHDFDQYEVSNFARNGTIARHNMAYWQRVPFKGFGVGACSFDGTQRIQNNKNIHKYMEGIEQGLSIDFFQESLTAQQVQLEKIMLALRRTQGIEQTQLLTLFSTAQQEEKLNYLLQLEQEQYIHRKNDRIILTAKGFAVHNEITTQLSRGI